MRKRQITIKEIAEILGISKSTVSRALRDASDINEETKKKVLSLSKELDYRPNTTALNLLKGKTHTIGVIIPSLTIPFYAEAISSMQTEADKHGYTVLICQSNENADQEKRNLDTLVKSGVDGIAISLSRETMNCDHIIHVQQKGIPVVLFNRITKCAGIPYIKVNDYIGSKMAMEFLLNQGKQKIAYIQGPSNLLLSQERLRGYKDALSERNIEPFLPYDEIPESDFTIGSGELLAEQILRAKKELPDAIYCICDAVAIGAISAVHKMGMKIPRDIAVVGFTNEPMSAFSKPPLTTVSQPIVEIGREVADVLIKEVEKKIWTGTENFALELEPELVVRESS